MGDGMDDILDDEFDAELLDEDFLLALDGEPQLPRQAAAPRAVHIEMDDLPLDTISSPSSAEFALASTGNSAARPGREMPSSVQREGQLRPARPERKAISAGLDPARMRQTTLWGFPVSNEGTIPQNTIGQAARPSVVNPNPAGEAVGGILSSRHVLDDEALKTWVYPTNLGNIRDYQYNIAHHSLFQNTLVALPTGLGKTFIAATVMLNFYRWTRTAKIVFVAPTKPLVSQQIEACFGIAGIPRSCTALLTGETKPAVRAEEWAARRVFFMTPQTLLNDMAAGYADPKTIVLLVIDEAHRAVGEYAYAKAVALMRRFTLDFRVLALTATPGSKIETVQEVIDNLGIAHIEIRTEESLDIRPYVHQRSTEQVLLDPSPEMVKVRTLLTQALQPFIDKLRQQGVGYGVRDPTSVTNYGLLQAQAEWFASRGRAAAQGVQMVMRATFNVLNGVAHAIKLLNFHGIKPFYDNVAELRRETLAKGDRGSKFRRQLVTNTSFSQMMDAIEAWMGTAAFVGHPKLAMLEGRVLSHLSEAGPDSRIIVFSEYRDSAEDIVRLLNMHQPLVRAAVFVGQADSKRSEGMRQRDQLEAIDRFKKGVSNVLVATSIGEEGLDIGQVDLIVCYDASSSPVRMLQRMGRTGRKRAGRVVLLLMRGKEEDQYAAAKDNYLHMQRLICQGTRFSFCHDLSRRIVPDSIRPQVDKRHVDIPVEESLDGSLLPLPNGNRKGGRSATVGKKRPAKKFHMPDGVTTGFVQASALTALGQRTASGALASVRSAGAVPKRAPAPPLETDFLAEVPPLAAVLLDEQELSDLNQLYREIPLRHAPYEEVSAPDLSAHPILQRTARPVVGLRHGQRTQRYVQLFSSMAALQASPLRSHFPHDHDKYLELPLAEFAPDTDTDPQPALPPLLPSSPSPSPPPLPLLKRRHLPQDQELHLPAKRPKFASNPQSRPKRPPRPKEKRPPRKPPPVVREAAVEGNGRSLVLDSRPDCPRSTLRHRNSKGPRRRPSITEDDLAGDDCQRSSDALETDGSDDGADMADFVVGDDVTVLTAPSSTPSIAPLRSVQSSRPEESANGDDDDDDDDDDDELPEVSAILLQKRPTLDQAKHKRKRPVLYTSDLEID